MRSGQPYGTSAPPSVMRPRAGRIAPAIALSSEDLPAPLAPKSTASWPSAMPSETPRTARIAP
jgi:hypothetical protein